LPSAGRGDRALREAVNYLCEHQLDRGMGFIALEAKLNGCGASLYGDHAAYLDSS
jgi:hypothetical protein